MTVEHIEDEKFLIGGFQYNAVTEEFENVTEKEALSQEYMDVLDLMIQCPEGFGLKNLLLASYLECDLEDTTYIEREDFRVVTKTERQTQYEGYCEDAFNETLEILQKHAPSVGAINYYWKSAWYRDFEVANGIDNVYPIIADFDDYLIINK